MLVDWILKKNARPFNILPISNILQEQNYTETERGMETEFHANTPIR